MCYPQPSVSTCLPFFSTESSLPWCYTETPSPPCRLLLFHMDTKWVRKKKKSEEGSVEAALQWLHCWNRLIVFSSVATVNPSDGWLTCSFHLSSLLGSSPRSTASTAAPLGGTRTWKQKILEGHSVFKTFHTSPFRTFGCRHQYESQFFFFFNSICGFFSGIDTFIWQWIGCDMQQGPLAGIQTRVRGVCGKHS